MGIYLGEGWEKPLSCSKLIKCNDKELIKDDQGVNFSNIKK